VACFAIAVAVDPAPLLVGLLPNATVVGITPDASILWQHPTGVSLANVTTAAGFLKVHYAFIYRNASGHSVLVTANSSKVNAMPLVDWNKEPIRFGDWGRVVAPDGGILALSGADLLGIGLTGQVTVLAKQTPLFPKALSGCYIYDTNVYALISAYSGKHSVQLAVYAPPEWLLATGDEFSVTADIKYNLVLPTSTAFTLLYATLDTHLKFHLILDYHIMTGKNSTYTLPDDFAVTVTNGDPSIALDPNAGVLYATGTRQSTYTLAALDLQQNSWNYTSIAAFEGLTYIKAWLI